MSEMLRKLLPSVWILIAVATLYTGWILITRYMARVDFNRAMAARQESLRQKAPASIPPGLRITQFYADRGELSKGEQVIICYGVQDAASVKIDPAVEDLKPSMNRCFSVTPAATTTYRLTAAAADGRETSEAFTVTVGPAPPRIEFVAVSSMEVKRGDKFTLCYGVKEAASVKLEPLGWTLPAAEKECRMWFPAATMKLTLIAFGEGGRTDRESVTIKVHSEKGRQDLSRE
jgi:hypothetical protein